MVRLVNDTESSFFYLKMLIGVALFGAAIFLAYNVFD